jgi:uncharacterized RDD family membrane protein YckC
MNEESQGTTSNDNDLQIAGFWRRLFAFMIDMFLLGVAGIVLGLVFSEFFISLGEWGRVVGFTIAIAYFGALNSQVGSGQTIGKGMLRLRVVTRDGTALSLPRSLSRAAVLCVPLILNGFVTGPDLSQTWVAVVLCVLVFGLGLSIVYLYIFNRKTRQSLHDLVVDSIVVAAQSHPSEPFTRLLWRGHLLVVAVVMGAACTAPYFTGRLTTTQPFAALMPLVESMGQQPGVDSVRVMEGTNWVKSSTGDSQTQKFVSIGVRSAMQATEFESLANRLAAIALAKYPGLGDQDYMVVSISRGYDIGIASGWRGNNFSFSPAQWRERIAAQTGVAVQAAK